MIALFSRSLPPKRLHYSKLIIFVLFGGQTKAWMRRRGAVAKWKKTTRQRRKRRAPSVKEY